MGSVLTNYFGNEILQNYLLNNPTWLTALTDDPGVAGDLATELNVLRQPAVWTSPGSKTVANSNLIIITQLPADTVPYLAVCDLASGGHMLVVIELPTELQAVQSGHLIVTPGDLAIRL